MKYLITLLSLIVIFAIASCSKDTIIDVPMENSCNTENVTYTNTMKTIFSGCTSSSCHGSSSGRSMANYNDAKAWAGMGRMIGALNHENGFSPMPKNAGKLDACQISQVSKWISNGFPE